MCVLIIVQTAVRRLTCARRRSAGNDARNATQAQGDPPESTGTTSLRSTPACVRGWILMTSNLENFLFAAFCESVTV